MYSAECLAVERGLSFAELMENAGRACSEIIFERYGIKKYLIISGKGKNGGDGFVCARILAEKGCDTTILLPCGRPVDDISINNMNLVDGGRIYETADHGSLINEADVIIDALFGTGFRGEPDEDISALINAVNSSGKPVVSIDTPSGTECDTAEIHGACFKAELTVAISALKPIHIMKPSRSVCGEIAVADIGITASELERSCDITKFILSDEDIRRSLPQRPEVSHKGTFGNALCILGSRNMPGAAKIASEGALRSGAGLVTLAFPDAAYNAIAPSIREQVMLPCPSGNEGTFSASAADTIIQKSKACTAALIGCGIGRNEETAALVKEIFGRIEIPLIADADALNCIGTSSDMIKNAKSSVIITPHPAEMSRLTGKSVSQITDGPCEAAADFARENGCTVILKGANTVVCNSRADRIYVNTSGNSGLAKGGSGDLLAGILVSLSAQGMEPFDAACAAVYIHGGCADEYAAYVSKAGMLPGDLISYLPGYLKKFE